MATHSGILAWSIPWTEEPGGLQSIAHSTVHSTELAMTEATYPAGTQAIQGPDFP